MKVKKLIDKYSQKFLNNAKQHAADALKTAPKKQFKKQQKQQVIQLVTKLQIKLEGLHHKVLQELFHIKQKTQKLMLKNQQK